MAARFTSTGHLPASGSIEAIIDEAVRDTADERSGAVSDVYPALAQVDPELFGLAMVDVNGAVNVSGDSHVNFTLMSVAKPFVFALVNEHLGAETVRDQVGVNATGLEFNSSEAILRSLDGRTNPMVNPGAITTTWLAPGSTLEQKWEWISSGMDAFAGRHLELDQETLTSALATNHTNRSLAQLLVEAGFTDMDPHNAVELYTRQSCLSVNSLDLAVMGATLADGGVNPITRQRVIGTTSCRCTLAVMATAGMYETSGAWLYDVGLPGKSGISGGIVTVSPGKGALGTFAPRLDSAGNSVRGQSVARLLSSALGLDLFASEVAAVPTEHSSDS